MKREVIQVEGFDFTFDPAACETCPGHCCRGESGNVWVNQHEISQISWFLQESQIDCMERYLHRVENRFSCKERASEHGLECIFFQGAEKKCAIYAARPSGCRTYPFWDYFKIHPDQVVKECPGIKKKEKRKIHNIRGL